MRDTEAMWNQVEPNWREAPPQLCAFPPYPCSYLPGRAWQLLGIYDDDIDRLMALGGQRFGSSYCLPLCAHCRACRPSRIDVERFRWSRSQRRTSRKNRSLRLSVEPAQYRVETYRLFEGYVRERFGTETSQYRTEDQKRRFYEAWMVHRPDRTVEIHYRDGSALLAVSLLDIGQKGLYSHYLYYDTAVPKRRLGIATILKEVQLCRELGRRHLYLGFSNERAPTMKYKNQFSGLELLLPDRGWVPLTKPEQAESTEKPEPPQLARSGSGLRATTYPVAPPQRSR